MAEVEPLTYTVAEAAAVVGVSPWLIRKAISEGALPLVPHTGRRRLISRKRLAEWIDQQEAS